MYDDNEKLLKEYQEGNKALARVIVENNLGLINHVLNGFRWAFNDNPNFENVFDRDDLSQEGVLGLYASLDTYDPDKGAFSSYAIYHIKQAIFRFYYDKGRVIRVPSWRRSDYNKLKRYEEQYMATYMEEPSLKQLARFSGMEIESILDLKRSFSNVASLEKPVESADSDMNLADVIPDHTDFYTESERKIIMPELKKDLDRMIADKIPVKQDAKVFRNYFRYQNKKTVKMIAEEHGIEVGQLTRIINKGIGNIKIRYQDELIEKYADIISSHIRKEREQDLSAMGIQSIIHEVIKLSLKSGDSLTIIDKKGEMIQATVWGVWTNQLRYDYVAFNEATGDYERKDNFVWINDIYDYRTEYKKVVEIRVKYL
jgi:RNA polymerase sigma factor (sigma-70 family)